MVICQRTEDLPDACTHFRSKVLSEAGYATTLATKINKVVMKEQEGRLMIVSVTYWTDSTIVLRYIANDVRRFVTFFGTKPG